MTPGDMPIDAAAGPPGEDRHGPAARTRRRRRHRRRSSGARRCGSAAPTSASKTAFTDAQGRYEFQNLPAGRFNVSVSKSGFVTMQYGQSRPFEPGRPIDLVDAQVMEKADVALPRGSAVSGRILDEFGEPVADASVTAMRMQYSGGQRRLVPVGRALDDQRSRAVPRVRAAARRVLRQRHGADDRQHDDGHARRRERRRAHRIQQQLRLRRHLLSRHAECRRSAARLRSRVGQELSSVDIQMQPVRLARDHRHRRRAPTASR